MLIAEKPLNCWKETSLLFLANQA